MTFLALITHGAAGGCVGVVTSRRVTVPFRFSPEPVARLARLRERLARTSLG